MCAMFRDRKPVEQNDDHATPKPSRFEKTARFARSEMWRQIGGVQAGRQWVVR